MRTFVETLFRNAEGGGSTAPAGDPPAGSAGGNGPPPVQQPPAGLESFWDDQSKSLKLDDLAKTYGELNTLKADYDKRLSEVPPDPNGYKLEFELPKDLKLPDGFKVEIDEKDPAVAALRQIAHENKLPQSLVSKLLSIQAEHTARKHIADLEANANWLPEQKKLLGENADQRISAVEGVLKQALPKPDLYEAMRIYATDAKTVEALETLIKHFNGGEIPAIRPEAQPVPQLTRAERMFPTMRT